MTLQNSQLFHSLDSFSNLSLDSFSSLSQDSLSNLSPVSLSILILDSLSCLSLDSSIQHRAVCSLNSIVGFLVQTTFQD